MWPFPSLCYCCIQKESAYNKLPLLLLCSYINLFLQGALDALLAYMNQTFCDPQEVRHYPNTWNSLPEKKYRRYCNDRSFPQCVWPYHTRFLKKLPCFNLKPENQINTFHANICELKLCVSHFSKQFNKTYLFYINNLCYLQLDMLHAHLLWHTSEKIILPG